MSEIITEFHCKAGRTFLVGLVCAISLAIHADEQLDVDEFGVVNFNVNCDAQIQPEVNRAVAQLHNMMYVQAEEMFGELAQENPDCAMLYWGAAMSNFHPLWPGVSSEPEMERGGIAIARAVELGGADAREQAYIDAVAAFYRDGATSFPERIAAWAKGQKKVYDAYPDDVDAAAFFALSHLAIAPKTDKAMTHQKEAGSLLEQLHVQSPQHPAGFHYLIHAYDNPLLASNAEAVSRAYDKIAPTVPHALHMPSHIFVRMGLWEETVFWNERSAQAALDESPENMTLSHFAHALDYKIYAHLQRGEPQQAVATLDQMNRITDHQNGFGSAYGLAAASTRIALETNDWEAASKIPVRVQQTIDWDKFPATEAIVYFARGIGAARSGDVEAALVAEATLRELHEQLGRDGPAYWETLVESQLNSVAAWIAYARDDMEQAENLMVTAATLEDSLDKSPVTSSAVLPARELLGDLYGLLDKHEEALTAYEAALMVSPNRARSLRGVIKEAMATGDTEKADQYRMSIADLAAPAQ
ncbi:MAG: hypothetical protein HKN42_16290 [Granulosicoccus sp.]|nr:hypothetical protein [Granulosicoccus sp.]